MNVHWLATESGAMLPPAQQVREPEAVYGDLSTEAFEIAHLFESLQPQSSGYIREQVFIYSVIDKSMPWLRHGKPMGKSYEEFEAWHHRNITATRDLEEQRAGLKPRQIKRQKEKTR